MHCFVNFWYYSWDHNICCDHPSVDRSPVTEEREMIWFMICLLVFFVSENKSCVNIKYKEARVFILVLTFHFFVTEKHGADSPRSSFGWLLLLVWVDQGLHWLGWSRQGSFSGQSKFKIIEFEIWWISTMGNSCYTTILFKYNSVLILRAGQLGVLVNQTSRSEWDILVSNWTNLKRNSNKYCIILSVINGFCVHKLYTDFNAGC